MKCHERVHFVAMPCHPMGGDRDMTSDALSA